jgi:hypothetical protein
MLLGVVVKTCNPSYSEGRGKGLAFSLPCFRNKIKTKDLGAWLNW